MAGRKENDQGTEHEEGKPARRRRKKVEAEATPEAIIADMLAIQAIVLSEGSPTDPNNPNHPGISIWLSDRYAQAFLPPKGSSVYVYEKRGADIPGNPLANIAAQLTYFEKSNIFNSVFNANIIPEAKNFPTLPGMREHRHPNEGFKAQSGNPENFSAPHRRAMKQVTQGVLQALQARQK